MSLDKALGLAEAGLKVFPLGAHKKPVLPRDWNGGTRGGFYHGTSDPEIVRSMWADAGRRAEHAGVWAGGSGLVCVDVDVDPAKGKDGFRSIRWAGKTVESPLSYETPRGGRHFLFRADDAAHANDFLAGVDIKGGGSYWVHYGPVPHALDIDLAPDAPDWVPRAGDRPTVKPVSVDEFAAWLAELPSGKANRRVDLLRIDHYASLFSPVGRVVRLGLEDGGARGLWDTFHSIINAYEQSPVTSISEHERESKVWQIGAWCYAQSTV